MVYNSPNNMKKFLYLLSLSLFVTACSRGSGFQEDRAKRHITNQLVCDFAVDSEFGYGPRTVVVDQELTLFFPPQFAPYAVYLERRDNSEASWEPYAILADVGGSLSAQFPTPGEYRAQGVANECYTPWGELYVLGPEPDFGIELFSHAPTNFDIEPLDNSFAAYFDIDVELAGATANNGAYFELIALDQAPFGPENIIDFGLLTGTSFSLNGQQLDPGRYILRAAVGNSSVHERTFRVFGER